MSDIATYVDLSNRIAEKQAEEPIVKETINKLEVKNLYKIFAPTQELSYEALKLLFDGYSKSEIMEKTGATLGLNNINLEIKAGEITVIMGLSGSGKSTLIRCFNGLVNPTLGRIVLDCEQDIAKMSASELLMFRRKRCAMVFQNFGLLPHLNVIDNITFGLKIQGIKHKARVKRAYEILDSVGLLGWEFAKPSQLSGGMQQRAGIARGLVNNSDIILMDEPFSALDPLIRDEMQNILLRIQEKYHKTIIFVSHDLDEAIKIGNKIVLMKDGEIIQEGTYNDILNNPANDYVRAFSQKANILLAFKAKDVMRSYDETEIIYSNASKQEYIDRLTDFEFPILYVVDDNNKYVGALKQRSLRGMQGDNNNFHYAEYLRNDDLSVSYDDNLEFLFNRYQEVRSKSLIVLNSERQPIGIIDGDTLIRAVKR